MQRPQWYVKKGIRLLRCGGLSHVRQDNLKAPEKFGLWCFIWPHFDWFFLGAECSRNKFPHKKLSQGEITEKEYYRLSKPRSFWYKGSIYTPINIPNSEKYERGSAGAFGQNYWFKTNDKQLFHYLHKVYASDLAALKRCFKPEAKASARWHESYREYISGSYQRPPKAPCGVDHFEVFLPRGKIRG
jgi:hypothetical protein